MWMLRTDRAELNFFVSPEDVVKKGKYAILSHRWGDDEQTFQDVEKLCRRCETSGENPRDLVSAKIQKCCMLAERDGYKWVWIDTCCIDKTSSAELSEAINSMYRYYVLSAVCYVFLDDWRSSRGPKEAAWSKWRRIKWFGRGWTLQELIAPEFVVFLNYAWRPVGSKGDLADAISYATDIPTPLLLHEQSLGDFSVHERMTWASSRSTTREEDEAYCLLGLFDITMPTLYGEGRKAFYRLQEEIMRRNPDTTIFAWGLPLTIEQMLKATDFVAPFLLADSPRPFWSHSLRGTKTSIRMKQTRAERARPTTFFVTPHGLQAHIPVANFRDITLADLGIGYQNSAVSLLLTLTRCPPGRDTEGTQSSEVHLSDGVWYRLGLTALDLTREKLAWKAEHIYLAHQPPPFSAIRNVPPGLAFANSLWSPFRFSAFRLVREPTLCMIELPVLPTSTSSLSPPSAHGRVHVCKIEFNSVLPSSAHWTATPPPFTSRTIARAYREPVLLEFRTPDFVVGSPPFVVQLGLCGATAPPAADGAYLQYEEIEDVQMVHWARADPVRDFDERRQSTEPSTWHECPRDHISTWTDRREGGQPDVMAKSFMLGCGWQLGVRLCFKPGVRRNQYWMQDLALVIVDDNDGS